MSLEIQYKVGFFNTISRLLPPWFLGPLFAAEQRSKNPPTTPTTS
jgi:hypothetical protein